jgi:signal peptidase
MEPGIDTGDLLIDRWVPTAELKVGDVVSLSSSVTDKVVTHRIVSITPTGDMWEVRMKGDANPEEDVEPYIVGDEVLQPALQVPGAGNVVSKLMDPAVALPILLALIALLGLSLLDEPARKRVTGPLEPDSGVGPGADSARGERTPLRRSRYLDELDEALEAVGIHVGVDDNQFDELDQSLSAVGVDVALIGEWAGGDWPDKWDVVWPDDDQPDALRRSRDDERELVPTG